MTTAFVEANGLEFEVEQCGNGDGLALCLHGFPEHAVSWRHQLPFLAALGYRAWAPNLRGYGRSGRPSSVADYDMEHLLADVAGLIDASGVKSTILIAHDWGGLIAWHFAARRIRPLKGLIVLNMPHPACFRQALGTRKQRWKSWYISAFQIPWLPEWLMSRKHGWLVGWALRQSARRAETFPEDVLNVYRANVTAPGAATAMLNWYRAAVRGRLLGRRRTALAIIETPTLIVWGDADVALDISTLDGTEAHVRDLTVRQLSGVSHWVQQEAPEAVNAAIKAFLADLPNQQRPPEEGGSG